MASEAFGCEVCLPDDVEAAAACWPKVPVTHALIAESHFSVKLRRCERCAQQFVSVFTEQIDWENGEDPQRSCAMPIDELDEARLRKAHASGRLEEAVCALAPTRRSVSTDWPSGRPKRIAWTRGMTIGPHD
ncbi:MAG: hypothetical protein AAF184_20350 [Pseudomonadota bacterium]